MRKKKEPEKAKPPQPTAKAPDVRCIVCGRAAVETKNWIAEFVIQTPEGHVDLAGRMGLCGRHWEDVMARVSRMTDIEGTTR